MGRNREISIASVLAVLLVAIVVVVDAKVSSTCAFPAIYNFGDSNSDTGGGSAAFKYRGSPYGMTYFHKPSGRYSDGRSMIDFIAKHLKMPYLNAYLDCLGTSYRQGANFATGGSTVLKQNKTGGQVEFSPIYLGLQIMQFTQFKERTGDLYTRAKHSWERKRLPVQNEFSKALYMFDIGQNDLTAAILAKQSFDQVNVTVQEVVDKIDSAVKNLYDQGARTFWIHNTGPIGCLPIKVQMVHDPMPGYLDRKGCVKDQNDMAMEFNRQLKEKVEQLRLTLTEAVLTYVDIYSAKYELISSAKEQGFGDPMQICCGVIWKGNIVWCGTTREFNGTKVYAGACEDPSSYISWDGIHYTEAANHWIAKRVVNGSFS